MGLIYQKNLLHFGEEKSCAILPLAQERDHPFYLYDLDGMRARAHKMRSCFPGVERHYAMKANSADRILKAFLQEDTGVDVVSGVTVAEIPVGANVGTPVSGELHAGNTNIKHSIKHKIFCISSFLLCTSFSHR